MGLVYLLSCINMLLTFENTFIYCNSSTCNGILWRGSGMSVGFEEGLFLQESICKSTGHKSKMEVSITGTSTCTLRTVHCCSSCFSCYSCSCLSSVTHIQWTTDINCYESFFFQTSLDEIKPENQKDSLLLPLLSY